MGVEAYDAMIQSIIKRSEKLKQKKKRKDNNSNNDSDTNKREEGQKNKGKLKIDATVAEQMIQYPTDHGLLNKAREESERLIDQLYKETELGKKPRTYRRKARSDYLAFSKKRKKTQKEIRKAVGKQIRYLRRNIGHIHNLLDILKAKPFPLSQRDQKIFWIIQELYRQQEEMYREKRHSTKDRIVSISQPYVRPIPRGKDKASVEFGAKIGASLTEGYVRISTLSWDAYNESNDLEKQVEQYKELYGYYPEVVMADKIYLNRENRKYLKGKGIRISGKPLGRPPKQESYYQKSKRRKENNERNHIEGKFGQGKNAYGLKNIRGKRIDTSESMIAGIFFAMNLVKCIQLFYSLIKSTNKLIQRVIKYLKPMMYLKYRSIYNVNLA